MRKRKTRKIYRGGMYDQEKTNLEAEIHNLGLELEVVKRKIEKINKNIESTTKAIKNNKEMINKQPHQTRGQNVELNLLIEEMKNLADKQEWFHASFNNSDKIKKELESIIRKKQKELNQVYEDEQKQMDELEKFRSMSREEKNELLGPLKKNINRVAQSEFKKFKRLALAKAQTEAKPGDRAEDEKKIIRDSMKKKGIKLLKIIITKNAEELSEILNCSDLLVPEHVGEFEEKLDKYVKYNYRELLEKYDLGPKEPVPKGAKGGKEDKAVRNEWNGIVQGLTNMVANIIATDTDADQAHSTIGIYEDVKKKVAERVAADTGAHQAQSAIEDPTGTMFDYLIDILYSTGKVTLLAAVIGGGKYNKSSKTKKKNRTRRRGRSRRTRGRGRSRRTRGRMRSRRTRGRGRTRQRK